MMHDATLRTRPAQTLRGLCGGAVYLPDDAGYDRARTPWNVAVDQRPAAVACPADAGDVAEVVRAAAAAGLRVAPQGTGHNAGPLGPLDDAVLLRTGRMTAVSVDVETCNVRAEAGAVWQDVVDVVAPHGLAVLHGSSPDVGIVGYSLGGGIGWFARRLGLATNSITAVELVTADGRLLRADADQHADLFFAVRGGGGNFGIVTALEFRAYPIETAYAGMLVWDWSQARRVLPRWAAWAATAPDAVTTSFRILQLPPLPAIPEPVRGRQLVVIDGAVLGSDEEAAEILAELRELGPEMDTFARVPSASLTRLHMDPEGPTPVVSESVVLADLPEEAIDAFLSTVGPGSGSSLLTAELRQLGGALGRPADGAGALPCLQGRFIGFCAGVPVTPEIGAKVAADAERMVAGLSPWASGSAFLNFVERRTDTRVAYSDEAWEKLVETRAAYDAAGVLQGNHAIPSARPVAALPRQR